MHVSNKVLQNIFCQNICNGVTSQAGTVFGRRTKGNAVSLTGGWFGNNKQYLAGEQILIFSDIKT